jgi:siroheme synthase
MTATWMWLRADLRHRWRSWVVLGVMAGISAGIACAAVAGARLTERVVPHYARLVHIPDAAILANDARFDETQRTAVARLPEVAATYPFMVPFASR